MKPGVLYPHSQPEVLRRRLGEAGIRHGADVRVDLELEVMRTTADGPTVYFCQMGPESVRVRHFTRRGGGEGSKELPVTVEFRGFQVPKKLDFGCYRLENVRLSANGRILIEVQGDTRVVAVEERLAAVP